MSTVRPESSAAAPGSRARHRRGRSLGSLLSSWPVHASARTPAHRGDRGAEQPPTAALPVPATDLVVPHRARA